ncbi:hypothetical protein SEVIR_7G269350v4 [Setaria viridis]
MISWLIPVGLAGVVVLLPSSQKPNSIPLWHRHDGIKLPAFPPHASFYLPSLRSRPHRLLAGLVSSTLSLRRLQVPRADLGGYEVRLWFGRIR